VDWARSNLSLNMYRAKASYAALIAAILLLAIPRGAGAADAPAEAKPAKASRTIPSGIGGMAWLTERRLLVVHDTKVGSAGPRIGVLEIPESGPPRYREAVTDWKGAGGESNDLEALAAIPGRKGEFFALESGYYKEKYGRLIRLRAKIEGDGPDAGCHVETISAWKLPADTVSLEGLVCLDRGDDKLLILVGERGGEVSAESVSGKLSWTEIKLDEPGQLEFEKSSQLPLRIPAEGWTKPASVRGCADLYVDSANQLWSVATEDPGDAGPFRSAIYQVGSVDVKSKPILTPAAKIAPRWRFDGAKVEAVAGPLAGVGVLSVATDDENYGALWRPLDAPK
jgi:hypothetical protein